MKTKLLLKLMGLSLMLSSLTTHAQYNLHYLSPENNRSQISVKSTVIDKKGYTTSVYTIKEKGTNNTDVHLIKVNASGNVLYQKIFGLQKSNEVGNGICLTDDQGNIVVGQYNHPKYGVGVLALKVDFSGKLLWSRWYGNPNIPDGNGITIERTQESKETYIIAGMVDKQKKIMGIKIDGDGNQIWSYFYFEPKLLGQKQDYVTDITQDYQTKGFVITGHEYDNYSNTTQTYRDIYTFGIDLNGAPARLYIKYRNDKSKGDYQPHITNTLSDKGFAITFSSYAPSIISNKKRILAVMKLAPNLLPTWTNYYINPDSQENYLLGHSIYDVNNKLFAVGGLSYYSTGNLAGVHPAYLRLTPNGVPQNFVLQNLKKRHYSTYMAQAPNQKEYVFHNFGRTTNNIDVQLIKTNINGFADPLCEKQLKLKWVEIKPEPKRQKYDRKWYSKSIKIDLKETKIDPVVIPCSQYFLKAKEENSQKGYEEDLMEKENVSIFPTLINAHANTAVNVLFKLPSPETAVIRVFDNLGKLIFEKNIDGMEGMNQTNIDVANIPLGVSYIRISTASDPNYTIQKMVRTN